MNFTIIKNGSMKKLFTVAGLLFYLNLFAVTQTVLVQNNSFSPPSFSIQKGDSIIWILNQGIHSLSSNKIPDGAASWSKMLDYSGATFMYVPLITGEYEYQCDIHAVAGMKGSFVVSNTRMHNPASDVRLKNNRVTDFLAFEVNNDIHAIPVIKDITGKIVKRFSETVLCDGKLQVADLPNGLYILELLIGEDSKNFRFIKWSQEQT
jgi:plastocyanin